MIICVCHRVNERDIAREARAGCRDFESLQQKLGVGTTCGTCLEFARAAFAAEREAQGSCGAAGCGAARAASLAT